MARRVFAPDIWISAMIGRTLPAARSASALTAATASPRAASIWGLPSLTPFRLRGRKAPTSSGRDQRPLLFRQRGVKVQNERIDVRTEFGDDERHAMRHQAGNEMDIAGKPIELGDRTGQRNVLAFASAAANCGRTIERIASLAVSTSTNSATIS